MTEEPTDRKVIDSDEYVRKKGKGCTEQPVKEGGSWEEPLNNRCI